jgi:hypothetical protein
MAFRWILERVGFTEKIELSPNKEVVSNKCVCLCVCIYSFMTVTCDKKNA